MKQKKIFAFDLDGTITQHKSKIEEANLRILQKLSKKYRVVIVGAGSCERISKQLYDISLDIIGQYGLEKARFESSGGDEKLTYIEKNVIEIDKEFFEKQISILRDKYSFNKYDGHSVEFHPSGIVTFPILGTEAKLTDKLNFDPKRERRREIYDDVQKHFPGSNVFIGGTSSFDISPLGYDKFNALQKYSSENNIAIDEVVYFGDDYGVGGNDEHIFKSSIDFIKVDSYLELARLIELAVKNYE